MSFKIKSRWLAVALLATSVYGAAETEGRTELWFPIGETLTYKVYWRIFPVAEARVTTEWVEEEREEETRILLAIKVTTRSYAILAAIYPVNDYIESITRDYVQIGIPGFGAVQTLYIVPEARFQGFFVRTGNLRVWISNDERCLCVKAVAKAPVIGTIKLLLDKVEGPGNDVWVRGRSQTGRPPAGKRSKGDRQNAN